MRTTLITEHPAWRKAPQGEPVRIVEHLDTVWLARWDPHHEQLLLSPLTGDRHGPAQPPVAYTSAVELPAAPEGVVPLFDALGRLGTVARLTNPSLWDAMVTAILRQVVTAKQAKKRHQSFYASYGRSFATPAGELSLVPTPGRVLGLSDEEFAAVGAKFNRTALLAAAKAFLDRGEHWSALDAESLIKELLEVPRIGPWTAAAAAADFTGDHSVYPHGDLAVRTWAAKAAPGLTLPGSEREFEALWRHWAPARTHLHALTLFTLTWGSNDRITGPGHEGRTHHL
ncbi:hypothetical protein AB0B01_17260 [Streptomyces sp. NPDC044571]|uniref:hypothetical protein n=1 Tax=Streptomyces sp. NPDC044571 TaxID=3155371 RepID=UPI0033BFFAC9